MHQKTKRENPLDVLIKVNYSHADDQRNRFPKLFVIRKQTDIPRHRSILSVCIRFVENAEILLALTETESKFVLILNEKDCDIINVK